MSIRRLLTGLLAGFLIMGTAACGSDSFSSGSDKVTIVGQKFTEAEVMTALYQQVLEKAGYSTDVKNFGARDVYLKSLKKGDVQVSADYLSSMTEALNRDANGPDAKPVSTPDEAATLEQLKKLASPLGIEPLQPAKAEDANAYAVTKKFALANNLKTLSDLGALGRPVALAANSDCSTRQDCAKGLESVYGIKLSKIEPLGFDSAETKKALTDDEVQLGQVATTDGALEGAGIVILEDDKSWQNAENLVPVVNSKWLAKNSKAADALNELSAALTTDDLASMNQKVDGERLKAEDVAKEWLKSKKLL